MGNVSSDSIIRQFEDKEIRAVWVHEEEEWYFSVVDVVGVLADSDSYQIARKYWNKVKQRLREEGSELVTNCHQLKMRAADGKMRKTDAANTEQLLRIIQSIPSKKAEPFKLWLAQVGRERIEETIDPEIAMQRAIATYQKKGYDEGWIRQRLFAIDIRKELTNEWRERGVRGGKEFAILTDEISQAWSGMTTRQYKDFKGLTKENLRDNMSNTELVLNMLAETTTTEISRVEQPEGFEESKEVARRGGAVAGQARKAIEAQTGKPVVTSMNALDFVNAFTGLLRAGTELIDAEE
ncbi:MAG: hypothetical protein IJ111_14090 [Eggerthellaceae bacterium]|nr:hypothetical protein [Eggerthellaceae bacterium]